MRKMMTASLAFASLLFVVSAAQAAEVTVKGAHLCCPQCSKLVDAALKDVDGVSDVASKNAAKTITFTAADDKAAEAGIKALAKAGFHGEATHGDKKLEFPASGAKKGDKADTVTLGDVHLCCGACVKGVEKAITDAKIEAEVATDRKASTVTLTGKDIDVTAAVAALNKAGFHATVKK